MLEIKINDNSYKNDFERLSRFDIVKKIIDKYKDVSRNYLS